MAISSFDEQGVSTLLNGIPGTSVHVQIDRQNKILEFDIDRKKIEINPVPYFAMLDEEIQDRIGMRGGRAKGRATTPSRTILRSYR